VRSPNPTLESPVNRGALPALLLGFVLGLSILKLGNPVILEDQIGLPANLAEWLQRPWPTRTGLYLLPLIVAVHWLMTPWAARLSAARLPAWLVTSVFAWLGWQVVSFTGTVDPRLSRLTLPHFAGIGACFFLGVCLGRGQWRPLMVGVAGGAVLCWLQAINQHTVEFREARQALLGGQAAGWTNVTPADLADLRRNSLVIRTNGVDIANPAILEKLARGRVHGSLVYPNALAGLVLLVFPVIATSLWRVGISLRPMLRGGTLLLLTLLAGGSLLWSGSRSGWLIALAMGACAVLRLPQLRRVRIPLVAVGLILGIAVFGVRNRDYFQRGATSVSARLDYWKGAVENTRSHPWLGSGPGTFMRPYSQLKRPDAEMTRLVHNDYLQQFSDSGIPGGLAYLIWIAGSVGLAWKRQFQASDPVVVSLLFGITAWLIQGFSEFSLYVPALAWTCFTLLGIAIGLPAQMPSTPGIPDSQTHESS